MQIAPYRLDAFFLLCEIRMDIEVEGGAYVGMTEQNAYGLVVAVAFDAPCGERMPQSVELHPRHLQILHQFFIVNAVGVRFYRFGRIRKQIMFRIHFGCES